MISAPIQGVTTGTVASVSRGPSEDRSSGLVSIQAGAFILAASVARQSHHESTLHLFLQRDLMINFAQTRLGTLCYIFAITDSGPEVRRRWQRDWSRSRLRNQGSAQWPIFFLFFQVQRSITMQPERWAKRLIARAIPFMTLGNPI
jgi:hypothetical protein